jgi:hypothetical protein
MGKHNQPRSRSEDLYFDLYQGILPGMSRPEPKDAQHRATRNYRTRLQKRGLARFEVLGLDADRDLVRSIARRLAENGPEASALRETVNRTIIGAQSNRGGILAALRRSPLVGADIKVARERGSGRKIKL